MVVFYPISLTDARFLCVMVVPWVLRFHCVLEVSCLSLMFRVRWFPLVDGL